MDPIASLPHAEAASTEGSGFNASAQHAQSPQRTLTVLEAREQMRSATEPEAHRIAGVTFEGRQEAVQKLQAGMASQHPSLAPERTLLSESYRHSEYSQKRVQTFLSALRWSEKSTQSWCSMILCCVVMQMKP